MDAAAAPASRRWIRDAGSIAIGVGAIWLGWQVILQPVVARAPVDIAVRLAPTSSTVLARAAQSELNDERADNARSLASDAVVRAPFNAAAVRVFGLSQEAAGNAEVADQAVTLAGNWSLRDSPTHLWLLQRRLKQGDYTSAFAHADTLIRRRAAFAESSFNLFIAAYDQDPRARGPLIRLVASRPPWRARMMDWLHQTPAGVRTLADLSVNLQRVGSPLTTAELERAYTLAAVQGRIGLIRVLRQTTGRPALSERVVNGAFSRPSQFAPIDWKLTQDTGLDVTLTPAEDRPGNLVLRADYNGEVTTVSAEQLLMLTPGRYTLQALHRSDDKAQVLQWQLTCLETGAELTRLRDVETDKTVWHSVVGSFAVPAQGCTAQWLRLKPLGTEFRKQTVSEFDDVTIQPAR